MGIMRLDFGCLAQVLALPEAAPFGAPVSDADAPGYSAVVERPMDLGTLRDGLERREYAHPADAYAEVRQVRPCHCTGERSRGNRLLLMAMAALLLKLCPAVLAVCYWLGRSVFCCTSFQVRSSLAF